MNNCAPNIIWLASYPKSGNTWLRALLSTLYNKGDLNINNLNISEKYSDRKIVERYSDIDTRYLYDNEAKDLQKEVFDYLSHQKEQLIVKIHDAYDPKNLPLNKTKTAIYIVRNPLDIAGSLANHINSSIYEAVNFLCDEHASFAPQQNNLNIARDFRQYLSTWSNHVQSWISHTDFPVLIVRYEDLLEYTFIEVKKILDFIDSFQFNDFEIEQAIKLCSFDNLRKLENNDGFIEKFSSKTKNFYRKGTKNNWEKELTPNLVKLILEKNKSAMLSLQYL